MSTIVHLTAPAQFGGLERVVSGLAAETARRGRRVVVFCAISPGMPVPAWATALADSGVHLEVHHVGNRAYLLERRLVRDLLRRERPSVVHTHGYRSDVLHRDVAARAGIPTASTAHGFSSGRAELSMNERMQVWSWRNFDAVVAVSVPLLEHLAGLGVSRGRLVHIRNGLVSTGSGQPRDLARRTLGLPPAGQVVGWVGRMSGEKDPLLAIEAFAAASLPAARFCYIGDGPMRASCEARAAELGIRDRVRFTGARADAASLLSAFDTLLLSSRTEGTPMTILEAALAEVPIVATAVGGVPDVIGSDATLVPHGDPAALGRALVEVLASPLDAKTRAQILRTRLKREDGEADWVGRYLELYEKLGGRR